MGCARLKAFIINVRAGAASETFCILAKDGERAHARAIGLMREKVTVARDSVCSPSLLESRKAVVSISPAHWECGTADNKWTVR